ncbi:MAG: hypothetical protein EPN92_14210 [Chitinophagaceae bacterium]|nr:MAG: hypothetical protein EPN92_14210 [Chitinophagaceae bacterium]
MIAIKQYTLFISLFLFTAAVSFAQRDPLLKPERGTVLFQEYVDKEQQRALKSDGKEDKLFTVSDNEEINFFVTNALIKKVNQLQYKIEKDSTIGGQAKVRYVRGLEYILKDLNANWRSKRFAVTSLPAILNAYDVCMEQDKKGLTIENIINNLQYDVGRPVVYSKAFDNNAGYISSRNILIRKYCILYPDQTFLMLKQHYSFKENPDIPFVDSLIIMAGYLYPRQLYDYASASNKLSAIIKKIDDPLIQAVLKMATSSGNGQLYFPFLDNIVKGKLTITDIDAVRNDSIQYYKLLVKTHLDYVSRAVNKDTARGFADLEQMLEKKAAEVFVNTINGLHEAPDGVRFRIIQSLNAQELYYLAVLTDGIIYTSSYVRGVYPLMMSRMGNRGDSLLKSVWFDKYRKFIKMAAGYNTLSNFLASFPNKENANDLMRAFVGNLEKSEGLEDGVDVADSYASIEETMKPLSDDMLANVRLNHRRNISQNNKKGIEVYNILEKLFLSADSTKNIDLTKELGIPPVYTVPYSSLANDSGRVIMQVFFYGEKSDMGIFNDFVSMYKNANWKMTANDKWVSFHSIKGRPVSIYANRALPQEGGEDEKAQKELCEYLVKNKIYPTVTIHRGHSYTAPYTIAQMAASSKIVFLGSCGGYHLIHDVLAKAPDAHIIASKQIGRTVINRPFFRILTEKARNGNNIDWIPFWKEFKREANVPEFDDYIPPYKNLGAIFIKAYKIAMGETGSEPVVAGSK